ncbi:MAG: glycoside hydrolase family 43 protein [Fibrobacter sp.]|nr:glycoside hydrolase family 43 protein [Fibrobacter sp.]MDY6389591.1 glycoside hydrolase family 43 protein [Fibrobacter sp.]
MGNLKHTLSIVLGTAAIAMAANPLTTKFYSADAAALVHNDSLFIFAGHDEQGPQGNNNKWFFMNDWHVLVTDDMENYHDYGAVLSWRTFKWASGNAFAGHCEYRNGKFYWYVAVHHATVVRDEGFAIGVAVADHPSGPWKDAIGKALITDDTPNDVALNIDPAIFYDGNDIWMYWGSWGAGRRVKLKSNMVELAGKPEDIKIRDFFEAPWMHKYRGNYYFTYASGYPSTINYSMAKSINGPWTQKGVLNDKMENSETNHQAVFKYLGHWYFMYHGATAPGGWTYCRSVNIDYLYYDKDANIQKIVRTKNGVDKVNNALVENGSYRLTVSHSNLSLVDEKGVVVQRAFNEKDRNHFWTVKRSGKNARHYTVQNVGTGLYYCPPKTLLDTVKTSASACEIRIENASAKKGYYLYGDYDSDFVGDVLNVSTDPGMPVITWVRTGTDNQKVQLQKAEAPERVSSSSVAVLSSSSAVVSSSSEALSSSSEAFSSSSEAFSSSSEEALNSEVGTSSSSETTGLQNRVAVEQSMRYDAAMQTVFFSENTRWAVFDVNGVALYRGFGREIRMNSLRSGVYLVKSGAKNMRILHRAR